MKKKIMTCLVAGSAAMLFAGSLHAQEDTSTTIGDDLKSATKKTGVAIEKGAKKVGNKTAELASKGKSAVVDKVYEDKKGPDGQTIYINNKSEYYWVDKKGHRHYVREADLVDKDD